MPSRLLTRSTFTSLLATTSAFPLHYLPSGHGLLDKRQTFSLPFGQPSISFGGPVTDVVQSIPVLESSPAVLPAPEPLIIPTPSDLPTVAEPPLLGGEDVLAEPPSADVLTALGIPPEEVDPTSPPPSEIQLPPISSEILVDPINGTIPSRFPPYNLYSLLSTPTAIDFLLADLNPNAPDPGLPVRCSATFATQEGTLDMNQIPYEPQVCVDVVSGLPSSSSLWAWQVLDYAGPGLFVVRVWRGWLDPKAGPCVVQEDGTATFCNTNYYGEHQIDAGMGDVLCDTEALTCESAAVIEIPVTSVTL